MTSELLSILFLTVVGVCGVCVMSVLFVLVSEWREYMILRGKRPGRSHE